MEVHDRAEGEERHDDRQARVQARDGAAATVDMCAAHEAEGGQQHRPDTDHGDLQSTLEVAAA